MKEFGGYIEFEHNNGNEYYSDLINLNCGRNCLAYILKAKAISKIYLPYFLCNSVDDVCKKYNVKIEYYNIGQDFLPEFNKKVSDNEALYIVNFYGQISDKEIKRYKEKYKNIIVDNAQAFFNKPIDDIDTIYTCRKYFGVPDGAYLKTYKKLEEELETDVSYQRMNFLLGRYEQGAEKFYSEYVYNNKLFKNEPIKYMSKLTHNLLRSIDYQFIIKRRTENFEFLNSKFKKYNKLNLSVPKGAFMYPLYIENGSEIKNELIKKKIFIPTLWPDVFDKTDKCAMEYDMAKNILPIPIDQRYNEEDMNYIMQEVITCIN